mmetsp:Transcript_18463/g.28322  ORF Transcript_18463/g.28322 Transcript_18463/m.28322 type:complete len:83 (-) Transcript_18463:446-694(-)
MLKEVRKFHKNAEMCKHHNGMRTNQNNCLYFYKITKMCVTIDKADDGSWKYVSSCGIYHHDMLKNSTDFRQLISFYGYPITL